MKGNEDYGQLSTYWYVDCAWEDSSALLRKGPVCGGEESRL